MASRPKHVSSLSDKISGLKFMQRAKAVQEKKQAGPSESTSTVRLQDAERDEHERAPENGNQKDVNEEHWVLPRAKVDQLKRTASMTSTISHEPGWNAWLIDAEEGGGRVAINDEEANATTTTRKVFGSWLRKGRKRKSEEAVVEQDMSPDLSDNDEEEGGESDDDVVDKGKKPKSNNENKKGTFMKPGSYNESKSDKLKRKEMKHDGQGPSERAIEREGTRKGQGRESSKESKHKKMNKGRGEVLSGFPDQSRLSKKKKVTTH